MSDEINAARLQGALDCAKLGYKVVILHGLKPDGSCTCGEPECTPGGKHQKSRGKHPHHRDWGKWASNQEISIRVRFKRWPNSNFGIKLGPDSGIVDFEVDDEEGEKRLREIFGGDIPRTPSFSSGRGVHRIFRWREGLPPQASIALGVADLKLGAGERASQSVFPPSQHYSGKTYKWNVTLDECEPAAIPDCVIQWMDQHLAKKNNETATKIVFNDMPHDDSPTAEEVIQKTRESKNGEQFSHLFYNGNDNGDHSRDDMSLCSRVAFFAGPDPALIDQIFRQSALMRSKWDERRGDSTYGRQTIERVLIKRTDFYKWKTKRKKARQQTPAEKEQSPSPIDSSMPFKSPLPKVWLPDGEITISYAAELLGDGLAATGKFYIRGGVPMRSSIDGEGEMRLEPLRPAPACSDFERVATLMKTKMVDNELKDVPAICDEAMARRLISSETFKERLPPIKVMSRCPVLIERANKLEVITGYDRESGIWAMGDEPLSISLDEAKSLLNTLVTDFHFATPGDHSRSLAAFITPALVFGGLLGGRSPIDVSEADESQAGKGYRNKVTTGIYRYSARTVKQRERGVGSLQEEFDASLIGGAPFVTFDNIRGSLNAPWFESFMTEKNYSARVPYSGPIEIDATRTVVLLTTNRAELTRDLANRCSVVRIRKRGDDYRYQTFPEGDLLTHVDAHQSKFLGAVFAIVREWHRQGRPVVANTAHDFRRWAGVLGWIVETILGCAPLTEGHRDVQARMTTPALTWLRDVALAVKDLGHVGEWLRSHKLLDVILSRGIETPGISPDCNPDEAAEFGKAVRALGRQMAKAVATDEMKIDDVTVKRRKGVDNNFHDIKEYAFFFEPRNVPAINPQSKPLNPESPECAQTLL